MKRMKKIITCASIVFFGFCASIFLPAGSARADLCPYPGVGSGGGALFAQGGFCDYPTEINGSHMHCEAGGFGVNGILGGATSGGGTFAFGGAGIAGLSCTWRCPDGAIAPAPNPPGLWREYMVVMNSTNSAKTTWHRTVFGANRFYRLRESRQKSDHRKHRKYRDDQSNRDHQHPRCK